MRGAPHRAPRRPATTADSRGAGASLSHQLASEQLRHILMFSDGLLVQSAFDHVYGYTIINDATARTLQNQHKQWFLGKSLDGYCPMGPCIVTADEVRDVGQLQLITRVNGEVRQDAPVSQLIFDIPTLIETLSRVMTLEPGDLIATGTCAGVGIGFNPPKFLKKGDRVAITIEPIGTLENPVE